MRMTTIFLAVIGMGLLFACCTESAQAQGGRGGRGGGMGGGMGMGANMQQGPIGLLAMPEVRRELKIDADTAQDLADLVQDVMEEIGETTRSMMQDLRGGDRGDRQEAMQKMAAQVRKMGDEAMVDVRKMLNEDQLKRLRELHLQRLGWAALEEDDVQKSLDLSSSQIEEIKELREEIAEERREMMQGMGGGRGQGGRGEGGRGEGGRGQGGGANREAMTEMQNKIQKMEEDGFKKIFTDDQTKQLQEMQGAKFEFPQPGPGGRGGAGRGGRGGRADF